MSRVAALLFFGVLGCSGSGSSLGSFPVTDPSGVAATLFNPSAVGIQGTVTSFGTNGRNCETCHSVLNGWVLTPSNDVLRFNDGQKNLQAQDGGIAQFASNATATDNSQLDPLFRANDGATSPADDVSTPDSRQRAYALLLSKALIRVGLPMPPGAEFTLSAVDDPYGHASVAELSLYRRTLPMTNLVFQRIVMWDGRESAHGEALNDALRQQAIDATLDHAQATSAPAADALTAIVNEEISSYFAQQLDGAAGDLASDGASGGPAKLIGQDPSAGASSSEVFQLFVAWLGSTNPRRASIARGEAIFNTRTFAIVGVSGLNDEQGQPSIQGTCSTCHDVPNVGTSSQGLLFDLGISDGSRRAPDLPLYTFVNSTTGEQRQSSDPGQALVTGVWKQMNRFKTPGLRGLSARAPYFHDGSASSIADCVEYLDARLQIGLAAGEKADLIAFLSAL